VTRVCGHTRRRSPELSAAKVKPKQIALYLLIAFVIVSIWKDPATSASYAAEFLSSVGQFLRSVYTKLAQFIENIGAEKKV
jgi:hypothetical protein